ncbi:MAG: hypothetical protein A2017_08530 [Lentisphaerae bacterium GWF2_44_16]|nr:MAG: hypothetical protein A2017_08530 [Lentisphaerae bacterium GWF2_44_16]
MEKELLKRHKFQFISCGFVYHKQAIEKSNIHLNDDSHILHICKGTGIVFINNEAYPLKRGVVVSIPAFTEFYFRLNPGFEMRNIHYKAWTYDGEPLDEIKTLPLVFSPDYFKYCEDTLEKMKKCQPLPYPASVKTETLAHKLIIRHLSSNSLISVLSASIEPGISEIYRRLQAADCKKYKAGKFAALCFLSVSQMNRKFKAHFKMAPQKFWEKNRFIHVCRALEKKGMNIAEISAAFAFSDQAHFSKWFKKISGISPIIYRKNLFKTGFHI